jgi:hypothetical protein
MDTFVRSPDSPPIWRLDDSISLTVPRAQYCYDHIDIGSDWCKTGDVPLIRRPDEGDFFRLPDFPLSRKNDSPSVPRLPGEDYFRRSA